MADAAVAATSPRRVWKQVEFYTFCVFSFVGKSILLMRLPYREWPINTFYTCALLVAFYCYFRFRQEIRAPLIVVFALAAAVAADILGNKFGFYGHPFGPLRDYDEFAHFAGSGFSAIAATWLIRAGTRRMGLRLKPPMLAVISTSVAFTYCGWYEILELWDELFYGDFVRIHTWDDTPNDLFYDFLGVILFVAVTCVFFARKDRRESNKEGGSDVGFKALFRSLPRDFLTFCFTTFAFGICSWIEIFKLFDQRWSGRVHFVGNQDCAINLQWELASSIGVALIAAMVIGRTTSRRTLIANPEG